MIVWGGDLYCVWGEACSTNTGGRYDPTADTWVAIAAGTTVAESRTVHTAVWTGTEMIVWGGARWDAGSTTLPATGGRYSPTSDTWAPVGANDVPGGRYHHTAVWTGSELIVWGGYDDAGNSLGSGGRYVAATDAWTPTSTGANVPTVRADHTAVWTGTEMIVWGGRSYQHGVPEHRSALLAADGHVAAHVDGGTSRPGAGATRPCGRERR